MADDYNGLFGWGDNPEGYNQSFKKTDDDGDDDGDGDGDDDHDGGDDDDDDDDDDPNFLAFREGLLVLIVLKKPDDALQETHSEITASSFP